MCSLLGQVNAKAHSFFMESGNGIDAASQPVRNLRDLSHDDHGCPLIDECGAHKPDPLIAPLQIYRLIASTGNSGRQKGHHSRESRVTLRLTRYASP